jgi:hypothetical protein
MLVDRQRLLSPGTKAEFGALSWHVEFLEMDVSDWLQRPHPEDSDTPVVRGHQTGFFLAYEPQRVNFSLCAAALPGFIGCNDVSRHDAKISVRAGFAGSELSALWPVDEGWRLMERQATLFSHCFVAQPIDGQAL